MVCLLFTPLYSHLCIFATACTKPLTLNIVWRTFITLGSRSSERLSQIRLIEFLYYLKLKALLDFPRNRRLWWVILTRFFTYQLLSVKAGNRLSISKKIVPEMLSTCLVLVVYYVFDLLGCLFFISQCSLRFTRACCKVCVSACCTV